MVKNKPRWSCDTYPTNEDCHACHVMTAEPWSSTDKLYNHGKTRDGNWILDEDETLSESSQDQKDTVSDRAQIYCFFIFYFKKYLQSSYS